MGDKRSLEVSLDTLVVAQCADYFRRAELIRDALLPRRVRSELVYLNSAILSAAESVAGERYGEDFIREIALHVGYAKSKVEGMSELTYKKYKKMIKEEITRRLYLDKE